MIKSEEESRIRVRKEFFEILRNRNIDLSLISTIWNDIDIRYSSKSFNNLRHIADMLDKLQLLMFNDEINRLAIILHSAVSDAILSETAENSTLYTSLILKRLNFSESEINQICKMILFTGSIESISIYDLEKIDYASDTFFSYMLRDLDLSILGSNKKLYKWYSNEVKKEYSIYSNKMIEIGRVDYLLKILSMKQIFTIPYFFNKYEKKARENIKWEIQQLTK